jgi:hypothetical protein
MTTRDDLLAALANAKLAWESVRFGHPDEPMLYSAMVRARARLTAYDAALREGYEATQPNLAPNPHNAKLHARNE